MRAVRVPLVAGAIAHALAWAVLLFLIFATTYTSQTVEATLPGEPPAEPVTATATFVEVNGLSALAIVATPVALTGLALLGLLAFRDRHARRIAWLWVSTIGVIGFCFVAIYSVGLLYLPAGVALMVAALADLARRDTAA